MVFPHVYHATSPPSIPRLQGLPACSKQWLHHEAVTLLPSPTRIQFCKVAGPTVPCGNHRIWTGWVLHSISIDEKDAKRLGYHV